MFKRCVFFCYKSKFAFPNKEYVGQRYWLTKKLLQSYKFFLVHSFPDHFSGSNVPHLEKYELIRKYLRKIKVAWKLILNFTYFKI